MSPAVEELRETGNFGFGDDANGFHPSIAEKTLDGFLKPSLIYISTQNKYN